MTQTQEHSDHKLFAANKKLQAKIGAGPLDERTIERCQKAMDQVSSVIDFAPLAQQFLQDLKTAIEAAKTGTTSKDEAVKNMTTAVMQLKANGNMFGYPLIGALANIMLNFLETTEELNADAFAIVEAHHLTLSAIVAKEMKGDGGPSGEKLREELSGACRRYTEKHAKKS